MVAPAQALIEKMHQEVIEGKKTYFRDTKMSPETFAMYKKSLIIQEVGNFDATTLEGPVNLSIRFLIYSSQSDMIKPSFQQYAASTFDRGCYFKVLDTYGHGYLRLIVLLHLPAYAVPFFALNTHPAEAKLVEQARSRFLSDEQLPKQEVLREEYWQKRTEFPLGIGSDGVYFYQFDYGDRQHLNPLYTPKGFFKRLFRK